MRFKRSAITVAIISTAIAFGQIQAQAVAAGANKVADEQDMSASVAKINLVDKAFLAKTENAHTRYQVQDDALRIVFDQISQAEASSKWPSMKFRPVSGSYDWNTKGGLKLTLENPSSEEVRVELKVADGLGIMGAATHQLDLPIYLAANKTTTVDFVFNGAAMNIEGYRGGSELDLKNIAEFQFYAVGPIGEQTVIIHDIDFIERTGDFVVSEARDSQVIEARVETLMTLADFEGAGDNVIERHKGTNITVVPKGEGQALRAHYTTESDYPTVKFSAGENGNSWDWSKYGDVALAFDIQNEADSGVQLFVRIDDALDEQLGGTATGAVHSRTGYVQVPGNSDGKYYFTFKDLAADMTSGMRGEPPKKSFAATPVIFGWGEQSLDLSNIVSFQLYMMNPKQDATLAIDNVSLIPNLSTDTTRYADLLDEFGQYRAEEWPEKVHGVEDLTKMAASDLALVERADTLTDRTKYSGWKQGPKLKGTGYFRTEKVAGKWALVDPEGYLYFATGVDNIRMDDSYTVTGIDFAEQEASASGSLRPSQVSTERYVDNKQARVERSPLRRGMFSWLPEFDDPLADNYSYAPMMHAGALKQGEIFSFYAANLQRKYQTKRAAEAIEIWKDVTLARMQDWGFTSLGNWSDAMYRANGKIPYTGHGWIVGDHQRINTGNDYWGPMHDPYDPQFRASVAVMASQLGEEINNDPWCIGYFVDNELSWGNTISDANHYSLAISGLRLNQANSSAKRVFDQILKEKYANIEALNKAWGIEIKSWDELAKGFNFAGEFTATVKSDLGVMLTSLADRYFAVVHEEMSKVLPNHLFLGSRFSDWGVTPEAAAAAAKHVDVMSYNLYATDLNSKGDWSRLAELDKPSMIGEFHFGSTDSGLFHPGIISSDNQQGRADSYAKYMHSVIDNPYFVGAHWFQYMDSPVTGRAWDGENYNVGFVTVTDTPYQALVKSALAVNKSLYKRRYGSVK